MRDEAFEVTTSMSDGERPTMTVAVTGDFDASCVRAFDQAVAGELGKIADVVIDLRSAMIIDSSALGALVRLCARAEEASAAHSTLIERPFHVKLMQVTGLFDPLHVRHIPG